MTGGLAVRGLVAGWEDEAVVDGADLDVAGGEIVALLGGNGSGKSTLLWAVAGLVRVRSGTVCVDGRRVDGSSADRLVRKGVVLLPQTRRVFPSMTVDENLQVAELGTGRPDVVAIRRRRDLWLDRFPGIAAKLAHPAGSLSGGEQQLVAIGRVVSAAPGVLLLDEPSAGLAAAAMAPCTAAFREMAAEGTAILLVEQNLAVADALADRRLYMGRGRVHDAPSGVDRP